MISHPRYGSNMQAQSEPRQFKWNPPTSMSSAEWWAITLHDDDPVPNEFIKLIKQKGCNWISFTDDSDTEVTYMAEDIDDLIQALTDLKGYL